MTALGFCGEAEPYCTEVTKEKEDEKEKKGADRSQGWGGWAGGNHLTPKPPLVFGAPALMGASWSWLRTRGPSVGIEGGGLPRLPGSAGRRDPGAFFPSPPSCRHPSLECGDRLRLPGSVTDGGIFPALTSPPPHPTPGWLADVPALLAAWLWQYRAGRGFRNPTLDSGRVRFSQGCLLPPVPTSQGTSLTNI